MSCFADRYPAEVDAGALLHFADLRGVEPSDEVIRGIQALAAKNGILVFDYSSVEPDYPDRVQRVLETAGVQAGTIEELGTQTYFAGDVHFKREHEQRKPHLSFTDAFEYMKENGLVSDDVYRNGVTVDAVVDGRDADVLYDLFFRAYGTISKHPCKQALGPEELRGMLSDRNIAKVVYRRDGVAETVCLITNNIDELTWINPIYYQSNYPQKYANRQVVWFPGIATDPDPGKMGHNVPKIIGPFSGSNRDCR
jgi:hypothetical protein